MNTKKTSFLDHSAVDTATPAQELVNALTHGIGAVLAFAGLVVLVAAAARRGDDLSVAAFGLFGVTMVFLYLASTLYHAHSDPGSKFVFEVFDHVAISVLIAGSYSAFALTILRDGPGWYLFAAVWALAAFDIVLESLFLNRWPLVTVVLYLVMGWLIVFVWGALTAAASPVLVGWLIAGGVAYTAGAVFYVLGRKWGWFHPVWHLFVLAGTVCHFFSALAVFP